MTNVREIKEPLVFVCEGPSDCNFVKAVEHHYTNGDSSDLSNRAGRRWWFLRDPKTSGGISASSGWPARTGLVLMIDANGDPERRFTEAARMLASLNPSVTRPFQLEGGYPARGIYLMPGPGRTGCLEDLLLDAIREKNPS